MMENYESSEKKTWRPEKVDQTSGALPRSPEQKAVRGHQQEMRLEREVETSSIMRSRVHFLL